MPFVVIKNGGQYEDHWSTPIGVADDMTVAEAFVIDRKAKDKAYFELLKKYQDALRVEEDAINKAMGGFVLQLEDVPRWAPGLSKNDITPEMRRERDGIQIRNMARHKKHDEYLTEFYNRCEEFSRKFLTEHGVDEKDFDLYLRPSYGDGSDIYYRIEDIPKIEG